MFSRERSILKGVGKALIINDRRINMLSWNQPCQQTKITSKKDFDLRRTQVGHLVKVPILCKVDTMGTPRNAKIMIWEMESPYHHLKLALDF
jgi:hypothetical protein